MLKQVKVIAHDQGDSFFMQHKHPDITHSVIKNGGSKSSPLEKYKPPEKKDEFKHFV